MTELNAAVLVLVAVIAVAGTVTSPLLLALLLARQRRGELILANARQDQLTRDEHARQDEVAAQAAKAAVLLLDKQNEAIERQEEVAARAAQAAEDLAESQRVIADKAAEAATLLLAANERVARSSEVTNGKLDVIHTLVNSDMTQAMQNEKDARVAGLVSLREILSLKDGKPTAAALAVIARSEVRIAELTATLADRAEAAEVVLAQETAMAAKGVPDARGTD